MRTWLFYKETTSGVGTVLEFRRVDHTGVSEILPPALKGIIPVPAGTNIADFTQTLVTKSGWVGSNARPADDEIGKVVLRGRW